MAILYSLRVKPNWDPSFSPAWTDLSDTLIEDQLPSISIGAERADVPLTTVVSDLSLEVSNADNRWDAIFDVSKIVGTLPPTNLSTIRAPLVHYCALMFCRKASEQAQWQVIFFGFVDPSSVIFNRMEKKLTLTAFAPGKLLDQGNAERVNRISPVFPGVIPARPFVMPLQVTHPATPPGGTAPDDSWWKLSSGSYNAAATPMLIGDQFEVVQSISAWTENMALTKLSNTVFNVVRVQPSGTDLYLQTAESEGLLASGGVAQLSHLTPWFSGQTWESLVQALVAEANTALTILGVSSDELLTVITTGLPLLPSNSNQITAQPIYSTDTPPTITGVSMGKFGPSAPTALFYTSQAVATAVGKLAEKVDILAPDTLAGNVAPVFHDPSSQPDGATAPEDGFTARVNSAQLTMAGSVIPDFQTNDIVMPGQDVHTFALQGAGTPPPIDVGFYYSTMWFRTPTSYFAGTGAPKRCYRIFAFGLNTTPPPSPTVVTGIFLTEMTTTNSGISWTLVSSVNIPSAPAYGQIFPKNGRTMRPCFKVFWLGVNSFLYCWTHPFDGAAYFKTATTDTQNCSVFSPQPAPFAGPSSSPGGPSLSSGFVTETTAGGGGNVFFFCNRKDMTACDFYYWTGATFALGTVVNSSGVALNLFGGDFINAVIDVQSGSPFTMYAMNGGNLMVLTYTFGGGTFTITKAQVVPIDTPNYDPQTETSLNSSRNTGALAWIAGKVTQNNPGEPNYGAQPFAMIVGTQQKIYIVSSSPTSIVDYADFEQLSVGGALQQLILVRGYQQFTGPDQVLVANPAAYFPVPTVTFKQRLVSAPTIRNVQAMTEACQDGLWILNYNSCKIVNTKDAPNLGPVYNHQVLTSLTGATFTMKPPRFPGSSSLLIDNRYITTQSFAQLLADYFAQDFVVPQQGATIVIRDPYTQGSGFTLSLLDVADYLVRAPDNISGVPLTRQGRIFTMDYQLDIGLLTLKVQ